MINRILQSMKADLESVSELIPETSYEHFLELFSEEQLVEIINKSDAQGWTPLHYAYLADNRNIIKFLILNGMHIMKDYPSYMKCIKWTRSEHKNIMKPETRNNMQCVFMVHRIYGMLEKLT